MKRNKILKSKDQLDLYISLRRLGEQILFSEKFLKGQISKTIEILPNCAKEKKSLRKELQEFLKLGKKNRKRRSSELKKVNKLLKKKPNDVQLLWKKVDIHLNIFNDCKDCLEIAQTLENICPIENLCDVIALYGILFYNGNNNKKGMELVDQALKLNPKCSRAVTAKIHILSSSDFFDTASEIEIVKLTDFLIELEPNDPDYLLIRAFGFLEFCKYEKARKLLENLENKVSWYEEKIRLSLLSFAYEGLEKKYECVVSALKGILLDPVCASGAVGSLIYVYNCNGKEEWSVELSKMRMDGILERYGVIEDRPKINLAYKYYNSGKYDEAMKLAKEALESGRNKIHFEYALSALVVGYCLYFQGKYIEAARYFCIAVSKDTYNSGDGLSWYGHALYQVAISNPEIGMDEILHGIPEKKEKYFGSVLENSLFLLVEANIAEPCSNIEFRVSLERIFENNKVAGERVLKPEVEFYELMFRKYAEIMENKVRNPFEKVEGNMDLILQIYRNYYLYARSFLFVCRMLYNDDYDHYVGKTDDDKDQLINSLFNKIEAWEDIRNRRESLCNLESGFCDCITLEFFNSSDEISVPKIFLI